MSEVRVYAPAMLFRIYQLVASVVLCFTGVGAFIAPYFLVQAVCNRVEVHPDRIVKRPFGGSVRFEDIARWGWHHRSTRPRSNFSTERTEWDHIVIQRKSGSYIRFCVQDFPESGDVADVLEAKIGPRTTGLQYSVIWPLRWP